MDSGYPVRVLSALGDNWPLLYFAPAALACAVLVGCVAMFFIARHEPADPGRAKIVSFHFVALAVAAASLAALLVLLGLGAVLLHELATLPGPGGATD